MCHRSADAAVLVSGSDRHGDRTKVLELMGDLELHWPAQRFGDSVAPINVVREVVGVVGTGRVVGNQSEVNWNAEHGFGRR